MKKSMSILLVVVLILSLFTGCLTGCSQEVGSTAPGEKLTRGAWIALLADSFYLNSITETPYFSDIVKGDALFNAVQACVDLGIIEKKRYI